MIESVRAKLHHERTVTNEGQWGKQVTLKFETRYDDTIPEDQRFQKATPSGSCDLTIDNPVALEFFKNNGREYYVDFVPVKKV